MNMRSLTLAALLCLTPVAAHALPILTPITVTFSGTVTGVGAIWNEWMPGFVDGAELYGSISGDTQYNCVGVGCVMPPAFLTLTVAGLYSISGYHGGSGPTIIQPTGVKSGGIGLCFTGFCFGDPQSISTFTFDVSLNPVNQTGHIFYEGFFSSAGGPHAWGATINKVAVNVPEPSTLLLLSTGVIGLGLRRRRRTL